jgi:signal transduction histidine kinase
VSLASLVGTAILWRNVIEVAVFAIVVAGGALWLSASNLTSARRIRSDADRSIRIERAAAAASGALLERDVADPVGTALAALIDGVDADAIFLETNSHEQPDEHGNLATVRDILHADQIDRPGTWELTGWRVGPFARTALQAGLDHTTRLSELDARTVAYYRAMEIRSEILLPIAIEGRWIGSVGLISADRDRVWTAAERGLLRYSAEMIGAYWERRDARARLEELIAAKDEFIASVSHEIRTPLTAVVGFASELNENIGKFTPHEQADLISLMTAQSQEVADIVDDLLTAARAEAGSIVIAPEVVSVRKLVGEVLSSHSGRVDFLMKDDLDVWADGRRSRQILRNLLTNADRYGGDVVSVHARRDGQGMIQIEVRDNGEGIPYSLRDHVFEPYGRAGSSSAQPASVGLGLSVARRLATLMDGQLELSAEEGWTVFTLLLPEAVVPAQIAG